MCLLIFFVYFWGLFSFSDTLLKNEMCQYFINLIGPNNPEGSNAESDLKKW